MVSATPLPITADHREAAGPLVAALRNMPAFELRVAYLPLGDYLVDNRLLVERKTLGDLTLSIKDGRLFDQGLRLAEAEQPALILLEGSARDLAKNGMRREAIQGALITLTLFLGLPLLRALDAEESARLMLYAARQARAYAAGTVPRKGARPRGRRQVQSNVLQGLPGVGPERAKRLLRRFGSVEAVMLADIAALQSVDGIGATTAKAIRWAVEDGAADVRYHGDDELPI